MSKSSDFGNFILLIIGAGFAGVLLGSWAFTAVLYIGMGVMVIGTVLYVLNALGVDLTRISPKAGSPASISRNAEISAKKIQELLTAVDTKNPQVIEKLVLEGNVSPFENGDWNGGALSANTLAAQQGYEPAVSFFKEWSSRGSLARFGPAKEAP